jgi:hypothetical protein
VRSRSAEGRAAPGIGHLVVGALLLTAGVVVSVMSKEVVWYGAVVVGIIEIARGLTLVRARR